MTFTLLIKVLLIFMFTGNNLKMQAFQEQKMEANVGEGRCA